MSLQRLRTTSWFSLVTFLSRTPFVIETTCTKVLGSSWQNLRSGAQLSVTVLSAQTSADPDGDPRLSFCFCLFCFLFCTSRLSLLSVVHRKTFKSIKIDLAINNQKSIFLLTAVIWLTISLVFRIKTCFSSYAAGYCRKNYISNFIIGWFCLLS